MWELVIHTSNMTDKGFFIFPLLLPYPYLNPQKKKKDFKHENK